MISNESPKHVSDCYASLECWSARRTNDIASKVIPDQNIQAILARNNALFNCLYFMESKLNVEFQDFDILDVGSASGYGLVPFLLAGFSLGNLHGIDLFEERIALGKKKIPGIKLHVGDATEMQQFSNGSFDMTMEQFCFCHIESDDTIRKIAKQMLRVTKVDGYILVLDWIVGSKKAHYNAINRKKIKSMFGVGSDTEIVRVYNAQLAPQVGRFISKNIPYLYPIFAKIFPFLVLSKLTLLRRKKYL